MRCPKCGYNSFDHLDSCKKCGKDLVEHKQKFGIVSVLFPGQMKPVDQAAEDESVVDDAVAAAAAATVVAAAAASAEGKGSADFTVDASTPTEAGEAEDFGFDFMGDSEEEEDLSFDELFEEAPADEDVEETLPSPEEKKTDTVDAATGFSFDAEEQTATSDDNSLEDDFGFDPAEKATEKAENLEADDFELPPAEEDEFSFDTDNVEFEDSDESDVGTEEDPKSPFDLPESLQQEAAPEETIDLYSTESTAVSVDIEEGDLLLTDSLAKEIAASKPEPQLMDDFFVAETDASTEAEEFTAESVDVDSQLKSNSAEVTHAAEVGPSAELPNTTESLLAAGAVASTAVAAKFPEAGNGKVDRVAAGLLPATGNRVAAFCCDLLLLLVVGISFVIAAEAAISTSGANLLPSMETLIDLSVPYFLVLFSLAFGYFTLFHFLAGQTPGKMLAGLRVETLTGEPLLFSQAFLRSVGGLLLLLPAGLGYLVILSSPERRGWNDQLAGTRLVSLKGLLE